MTRKMEESMNITTEIPSVSIQIIILKLCVFFLFFICHNVQDSRAKTHHSVCNQPVQLLPNLWQFHKEKREKKKKKKRERERMLLHFHFYFSLKKRHCFLYIFYCSIVALQYWFVSAVQQSESAICLYIPLLFWISFSFISPQNSEQSSLCYTVRSHQLSN